MALFIHPYQYYSNYSTNLAGRVRTTTGSNPVPGFGIQLSGAGGTAAGFDVYTAAPSMKTYNSSTGAWVGVPNTNTAGIKATDGYMVFVRGDRTPHPLYQLHQPFYVPKVPYIPAIKLPLQ